MQRRYGLHPARERDRDEGRMLTVGLPAPYDGVGKALQRSFHPMHGDLPADMLDLLAKLDGN